MALFRRSIATLFLAFMLPMAVSADISEALPTKIDPADSWVFYAHGSAVYQKNKTIGWKKKAGAFSGQGYRVITAERFDVDEETGYAEKVVEQVSHLLKNGVPPYKIFVGGYSRGAVITVDVASRLANPEINYFLIAGCKQDEDIAGNVQGRILSLYGSDDEKDYGSCAEALADKPGIALTEKEFAGKGHKYFSGLNSSWFNPIRDWIKQANRGADGP